MLNEKYFKYFACCKINGKLFLSTFGYKDFKENKIIINLRHVNHCQKEEIYLKFSLELI